MFLCVGPFNQLSRGSRRFPPAQGGGPSRRGKGFRDPPLFHQLQGRFLVRRVCYCLLVGYVDEIPATYKQPAFIGAEDWGCEVHRWLIAWWENASYNSSSFRNYRKNTIFTHKDQSTLGRLQARVSSWIHLHPGLDDHMVTSWERWECQAA